MEKANPGFLARVASEGGVSALEQNEVWLRTSADVLVGLYEDLCGGTFGDEDINFPAGTPEHAKQQARKVVAEENEDEWAVEGVRIRRRAYRMRQEAATIRRAFGSQEFDETQGLGTLIPLIRGQQSQKSLERLQTYLKRFIAFLGSDRDPSAVRKSDAVGWRDDMIRRGVTGVNQAQQLAKVSAAFNRAVSKGALQLNPFAGVKPEYTLEEKKISRKKRAFTPEELRALSVASLSQPAPFGTIIQCLILTGARSSEICGLRVKDLRLIDGVLCFDINDENRSVKNAASVRAVPVPSILIDKLTALCAKLPPEVPLFKGLPKRKQGPAHKLQIDASKLIRAHVTTDRRLTLHCLRHTWRQRAARLKIDRDTSRAILGHVEGVDDHDLTYGVRPTVVELAPSLELVAESLWRDAVEEHEGGEAGVP
jgi:integrase